MAKTKDDYVKMGFAAYALRGDAQYTFKSLPVSWQDKAFNQGWTNAMEADQDEASVPKSRIVAVWRQSKKERDALKRRDATIRECNRVMRGARLDNETAQIGKARGHYRNAAPVSPNITRR